MLYDYRGSFGCLCASLLLSFLFLYLHLKDVDLLTPEPPATGLLHVDARTATGLLWSVSKPALSKNVVREESERSRA